MSNKSYILRAFLENPWAILPSKLAVLEEIVARHVAGEKLDAEEIQARIQGAVRPQNKQVHSVAVLPLFGIIFPKANLMTEMSGATSAEQFGAQFARLMDDPSIDAIVIDVDSPGGNVYGIEEVSQQIYEARGRKPVVAVADHQMASAAYWIGSAADEIVVSPSSEVGSIGVFAAHTDMSVALEKEGYKISLISAGKYKTEGNPWEPLGEEAKAAIQKSVDEYYDKFSGAVARNRGVKVSTVRNGFGEGRVVGAEEAVKLGMADRIGTLEETVDRLLGGDAGQRSAFSGQRLGGDGDLLSKSVDTSDGQEPVADSNVHTQWARARLEKVSKNDFQGDSMNTFLRDLLKARSEKITRAQAIVDGADKESRDLNEAERAEFAQLLGEGDSTGEVGALDARIEKIEGERGRLRKAAAKKFNAGGSDDIEKPDGQGNKMKMAEFRKLDAAAQMAFIKSDGKLED